MSGPSAAARTGWGPGAAATTVTDQLILVQSTLDKSDISANDISSRKPMHLLIILLSLFLVSP